jgi:hypothetical protein
MSQHTVDVSGRCYAVRVYQYADNLWIADGEVFDHQLRTIGRTAKKAVSAWQNAATERGRDSASYLISEESRRPSITA